MAKVPCRPEPPVRGAGVAVRRRDASATRQAPLGVGIENVAVRIRPELWLPGKRPGLRRHPVRPMTVEHIGSLSSSITALDQGGAVRRRLSRSGWILDGPASTSGVANHLRAAIAVVDVGANLDHAQRARVVGRGDLLGPRTSQAPDDGDLDGWPLRRIHAVPGG